MSTSKLPTTTSTTTTTPDPSLTWPNVRVTSSTSIQTIVSSALLHLADPSSSPLILHTLPSSSNSSSSSSGSTKSIAIVPKNSHAGLCKLISVVEIIKREFENHQKEAWRLEDEKLKKLELKRLKEERKKAAADKKGKKRARDEAEDGMNTEEQVAKEHADTADNNAEARESTSNDASKPAKKSMKEKKQERPLLRVYQYNVLDSYERLPGASFSGAAEGDGSADSSDSESDEDEEEESSNVQADLVKSKITAVKSLDDAIQKHVVRAKKRPRKKHTPYMKIILSTRKLPEYEHYLKSLPSSSTERQPKDYTIQLPAASSGKNKRSRPSRKKRKQDKDGAPEDKEEGEVAEKERNGEEDRAKEGDIKKDASAPALPGRDEDGNIASAIIEKNASTGPSRQLENTPESKAGRSKSKKRKADDMDTQSTEATQKSSQL